MEVKINTQSFDDKEMLNDALSTQKFLTGDYNAIASECAHPAVRDEFMNILNEEHQIQQEIFSEMQKRGWYQVEAAEQQKVDQAKQKYTNSNPAQNASN